MAVSLGMQKKVKQAVNIKFISVSKKALTPNKEAYNPRVNATSIPFDISVERDALSCRNTG